jgi:hypothetical protein
MTKLLIRDHGYRPAGGGPKPTGESPGRVDWSAAFAHIVNGVEIHDNMVALAASMAAIGIGQEHIAHTPRALLGASTAPHDERWRERFDDAWRIAKSAIEFIKKQKPSAPPTFSEALRTMAFDPLKFVVPGVIIEGLTLLAGKPKIGKSWLLLHAAIAVARGGFTLGEIKCPEGDVLYCALEDNLPRLKSRMMKLIGPDQDWPKRLAFQCELPRLSEGGLDAIKTWVANAADPRLIVIDTLAMVKAPRTKNDNAYDADYNAVLALRTFAAEHHVAVVLVYHLRKADSDDAFDTVSGTLGLTGAPDTVLILKRDASGGVVLHGRGRDLTEIEQAMQFNKDGCTWSLLVSLFPTRARVCLLLKKSFIAQLNG